jgi:ABC-type antimicrobial peptide transport system permease subunit
VGIYGVISYSVAQATRECGVRIARGASTRAIYALVLARTARLVAAGVIGGLAGAFAVTRVLAGLLYGVSTVDPATFVVVPVMLAAVSLLASYVPARRAARVAPVVALRTE